MTAEWQRRPERGGRRITKFYIWLCLSVGRRLARPILYGIAFYFFSTAPAERAASRRYLERVMGRRPTWIQIYLHFLTFSSVIMDRLFFLAGRTNELKLTLRGVEDFDRLVETGQGALLASAHFGSFEALRALGVSNRRLPIKALMYIDNARQLNELFEVINPKVAESVIPLGRPGAMLQVKEWVGQGGIVGILADRATRGDRFARVPFLGGMADFPLGPWLLANTLRVPVMLCFAVYSGGGRYDIHFEHFCSGPVADQEQRRAIATRAATRFAARLEQYCRDAPYNWFNFYDFWEPDDAARPMNTDGRS